MKSTRVYLKTEQEQEQIRKLAALPKKTGAPVAELIRGAIDAYLKEKQGGTT